MKNLLTSITLGALLLAAASAGAAEQVKLTADLAQPVIATGAKSTTFLKIGLTGFEGAKSTGRAPVNLAIVLDRSSSMAGEKLAKAKEAAILILDRLDERDIVSVVTYDSSVEVLVPATKISDRSMIADRIRGLDARGMTALFAGVSKGAQEIRKFLDKNRVNRVILLSDGQANVGPSSPNELGQLGVACAKENIAVTTIGLGLDYNEDLMAQLAQKSDGNHSFVESPEQLASIFQAELGDVLSVIAQEVTIKVQFEGGARPIRVLNRDAEIRGALAILSLNQLYARQEKFFLVEVEMPASATAGAKPVASIDVSYANVLTKATDRLSASVGVRYTPLLAEVKKATKKEVMVDAVEAIATEKNELAVSLRDEGKVQQAQQLLLDNSAFLKENAVRFGSQKLEAYGTSNEADAKNLEGDNWRRQRKVMRKSQYSNQSQQSY